jgi:hypothetical protein
LIDTPDEEAATQSSMVLACAPHRRLLPTGAKRLRDAGRDVTLFAGDEISHNRTDGPTWHTRPLPRDTANA